MRQYTYLIKLFLTTMLIFLNHILFFDLNPLPMVLILTLVFAYHHYFSQDTMVHRYNFDHFNTNHITYCIFMGFLLLVFIIGYTGLIELMDYQPMLKTSIISISKFDRLSSPILAFILVIPFYEELMFRGLIQKLLQRKLPGTIAVICQALMYSLYHLDVIEILPAFVLGLVTGFVIYYTNSIWTGILVHGINNLLIVALSKVMTTPSDVYNDFIFFIMMVVSGVAIIYILSKLWDMRMKGLAQAHPSESYKENHSFHSI